jgi:asparagine N-glycosylation enzyme membrane subunit Stt3
VVILTLFAVLWLACSVIPSYSYIFPEGRQPRMAGPDAYFHLRHTEAVLAHYPVIERFDLMTNFPDGEIGLNQGFFDVAMATISKITGLAPVLVLAWVSPFLMLIDRESGATSGSPAERGGGAALFSCSSLFFIRAP